MVTLTTQKVLILGLTQSGRVFRPSDWAERLAGVMSSFRPNGAHRSNHFSYSPWCVPSTHHGVKCVIVSEALRHHNVMAWDFCINFAKDNELQTLQLEPGVLEKIASLHPAAHHKTNHGMTHHAEQQQARVSAPVSSMPAIA